MIGFLRAAARLRYVNLQAVYGASAAELQETIKETTLSLKNWSKHFVFPDDQLAGLKQNLSSEYKSAFEDFVSARRILVEHRDQIDGAHLRAQEKIQELCNESKISINDLDQLKGVLSEVPNLRDRSARFASEDPQKIGSFILSPQYYDEKIQKIVNKNDPELPRQVRDTFSGLSSWSSTITRWEKAFFLIYDFWLVWLAVFLASAGAIMRLFYSNRLNGFLIDIGWLPITG
ncbi:hypothetical protein [Porphyrobacter sp. TH134]|uniref:hypothetical protein n=1 Tax=Porphyrobacter sp. TH134 TaxID=2067450 RepID=UPI0015533B7D|nr:hypothetical protein [Porphyrobacter sp. TH134]